MQRYPERISPTNTFFFSYADDEIPVTCHDHQPYSYCKFQEFL